MSKFSSDALDLDIHYDALNDRHYKYVDGNIVYGMVSMSGQFIPWEGWNTAPKEELLKTADVEIQAEEEWERKTLRDMFAMHAMAVLIIGSDPKSAAIRAYQYADAMMVARDLS